jgi:hypothetical protein
MPRTLLCTAALCICACTSAWWAGGSSSEAVAAQAQTREAHTVRLTAAFSPERLGAGTTIRFGLQVATPAGRAPSAVTDIELLLPPGLGIVTSDLGLETCVPSKLEHEGLAGCPPDSLMGRGSAAAEVPFGSAFVTERAPITLFSGPLQDGHPQLLFFADGEYPVLANIIFGALVLPAQAPFGGLLNATLPLLPSVPEGPDVALVRLQTTIGAKGITYYERVNGKTISFHPRGILLPRSCPRGGFPFAAHLTFQDATHASAGAVVPCPQGVDGRRWPIPDDRSSSSIVRVRSTLRSPRP